MYLKTDCISIKEDGVSEVKVAAMFADGGRLADTQNTESKI